METQRKRSVHQQGDCVCVCLFCSCVEFNLWLALFPPLSHTVLERLGYLDHMEGSYVSTRCGTSFLALGNLCDVSMDFFFGNHQDFRLEFVLMYERKVCLNLSFSMLTTGQGFIIFTISNERFFLDLAVWQLQVVLIILKWLCTLYKNWLIILTLKCLTFI